MTDVDDQVIDETKTKQKAKRPSMYNVILLNDDFTPMDFVTQLLVELFDKSYEAAMSIMLEVHKSGRGIAGTYSKEIANEKSSDANRAASYHGYPLRTIVEEMPSDDDED